MGDLKPPCYGISICFNRESKTCKTCSFENQCFADSKEEAISLSKDYIMDDWLVRFDCKSDNLTTNKVRNAAVEPVYWVLTKELQEVVNCMPDRPAKIAKSIVRCGIDIKGKMALGINPIKRRKYKYLKDACDFLLDDGYSYQGLTQYYMDKYKCGVSTARNYTWLSTEILLGLQVIEWYDSRLILRGE